MATTPTVTAAASSAAMTSIRAARSFIKFAFTTSIAERLPAISWLPVSANTTHVLVTLWPTVAKEATKGKNVNTRHHRLWTPKMRPMDTPTATRNTTLPTM